MNTVKLIILPLLLSFLPLHSMKKGAEAPLLGQKSEKQRRKIELLQLLQERREENELKQNKGSNKSSRCSLQ